MAANGYDIVENMGVDDGGEVDKKGPLKRSRGAKSSGECGSENKDPINDQMNQLFTRVFGWGDYAMDKTGVCLDLSPDNNDTNVNAIQTIIFETLALLCSSTSVVDAKLIYNELTKAASDACPSISNGLAFPKEILDTNDKQVLMLQYLMECYKRVGSEEKIAPLKFSVSPLIDLLTEIRVQCVTSAAFLLTNGFQRNKLTNSALLHFFLNQCFPRGFLFELVSFTYNEDGIRGSFKLIFERLLRSLWQEMQKNASMTSENAYKRPLQALAKLCDIKVGQNRPICQLLVQMKNWLPEIMTDANGKELSRISFLAPFMRLTVFAEDDDKIVDKFYGGSGSKLSQESTRMINQSLQNQLEYIRNKLFHILHALLVNSSTRENAMNFLTEAIKRNDKRAQLQTNEKKVAGDGFMLNLVSVLQMLAIKIKIDEVDMYYQFHPASRIPIKKDENRIKLTGGEIENWLKELRVSGNHQWADPKFSSECFFLAMQAHHVGVISCLRKYTQRIIAIREYSKIAEDLLTSEPLWQNSQEANKNRQMIKRWKDEGKRLAKAKVCADAGLLDPNLLARCLSFYNTVITLLLKIINCDKSDCIQLPLPNPVPLVFAACPEWYIEDIADFLLFAIQYVPHVLEMHTGDELFVFIIVFICSPNYISNPYLVAKLIEVLFVSSPILHQFTKVFHTRILYHPLAQANLARSLMKFYADVETTGSSSEFNNKYTIRYHISIIFKSLWTNPIYKKAVVDESKTGTQFVRFINMLMNDTTFLLDKSLESLKRIHEMQEEMEQNYEWNSQPQDQIQSRHRQFINDEQQCRSYLTLATETVDMFQYLTEHIKEPFLNGNYKEAIKKHYIYFTISLFLKQELVERLASMLRLNLKQICGPQDKKFQGDIKQDNGKNKNEMRKKKLTEYSENELDIVNQQEQPTDYSKMFQEQTLEDFEAPNIRNFTTTEDSVKIYQTEGTPLNFSTSSSLTDLRDVNDKFPTVSSKGIKDMKFFKKPIPPKKPLKLMKIQKNQIKPDKQVTFVQEIEFVQETPLMFSRSSSLSSLSSFEIKSIIDDKSSVVSDFSRRNSEVVSPSDLPESPGQTVPNTPITNKTFHFHVSSEKYTNLKPIPEINSPDLLKIYNVEDTPAQLSRATSLSSLTVGDIEKREELIDHSKNENFVSSAFENEITDNQILKMNNNNLIQNSFKTIPFENENLKIFLTEDTPANLSYAASISELSFSNHEELSSFTRVDEDNSFSNSSSEDEDESILQLCIQSALPKAANTIPAPELQNNFIMDRFADGESSPDNSPKHFNQPNKEERKNKIEEKSLEDRDNGKRFVETMSTTLMIQDQKPVMATKLFDADQINYLEPLHHVSRRSSVSSDEDDESEQQLLQECISFGMPSVEQKSKIPKKLASRPKTSKTGFITPEEKGQKDESFHEKAFNKTSHQKMYKRSLKLSNSFTDSMSDLENVRPPSLMEDLSLSLNSSLSESLGLVKNTHNRVKTRQKYHLDKDQKLGMRKSMSCSNDILLDQVNPPSLMEDISGISSSCGSAGSLNDDYKHVKPLNLNLVRKFTDEMRHLTANCTSKTISKTIVIDKLKSPSALSTRKKKNDETYNVYREEDTSDLEDFDDLPKDSNDVSTLVPEETFIDVTEDTLKDTMTPVCEYIPYVWASDKRTPKRGSKEFNNYVLNENAKLLAHTIRQDGFSLKEERITPIGSEDNLLEIETISLIDSDDDSKATYICSPRKARIVKPVNRKDIKKDGKFDLLIQKTFKSFSSPKRKQTVCAQKDIQVTPVKPTKTSALRASRSKSSVSKSIKKN